jgi:hypothetical protein
MGGPEGFAIGGEGQWLTDGLMQGGAGVVYWFGRLNEPGFTFFVRAGARYAERSAAEIQPRAGIGLLWRSGNNWGVQFDYAAVPIGELGIYHYATIGVRLPPGKPRPAAMPEPKLKPEPVPAPVVSVVRTPQPFEEEPVIYFCPDRGEKAKIAVEVRIESPLGASLLDREGRFIRPIMESLVVRPGKYDIEWDGTVDYGVPARLETPYIIQISANGETLYRKAVPKERR